MDSGSYTSTSTSSNRACGGRLIPGHLACLFFVIAFLLVVTSFVSPDWLAVNDEIKPHSTKFQKLGLWMSCYTDLHDPYYYDPYLTNGYQGCRWIYYPVVASFYDLKEYMLPGFLVPVQISYTLCFATLVICLVLVLTYLVKFSTKDEGLIHFLIALGMLMNMSALLGEVAVIVFGSLSGSRTWAEQWQFNYLSWAFIVAVVGVVLLHLAGLLFLLEGLRQYKRRQHERPRGMGGGSSQVSVYKEKEAPPPPVKISRSAKNGDKLSTSTTPFRTRIQQILNGAGGQKKVECAAPAGAGSKAESDELSAQQLSNLLSPSPSPKTEQQLMSQRLMDKFSDSKSKARTSTPTPTTPPPPLPKPGSEITYKQYKAEKASPTSPYLRYGAFSYLGTSSGPPGVRDDVVSSPSITPTTPSPRDSAIGSMKSNYSPTSRQHHQQQQQPEYSPTYSDKVAITELETLQGSPRSPRRKLFDETIDHDDKNNNNNDDSYYMTPDRLREVSKALFSGQPHQPRTSPTNQFFKSGQTAPPPPDSDSPPSTQFRPSAPQSESLPRGTTTTTSEERASDIRIVTEESQQVIPRPSRGIKMKKLTSTNNGNGNHRPSNGRNVAEKETTSTTAMTSSEFEDILVSHQPVAVKIIMQKKHKTETSYTRARTVTSPNRSGFTESSM